VVVSCWVDVLFQWQSLSDLVCVCTLDEASDLEVRQVLQEVVPVAAFLYFPQDRQ
jgi:hypothetical protein